MKKKLFIIGIITALLLLFGFITYQFIGFFDYKTSLSNLKKYQLSNDEIVIKEIKYDNKHYVISKDKASSQSNLTILLKDNNTYYMLENIKSCEVLDDQSNMYVKDNELYLHCIGKMKVIDKYTINDFDVNKSTISFNFDDTPNISQLHMGIDSVDNKYIYLSTAFKADNTVKDKPKVKCSFSSKKCSYVE